ncbi:MAG: hypothetical protein AABY90_01325, partial [Nitrospirota bacterium]
GLVVGGAAFAYLALRYPATSPLDVLLFALFPAMAFWLGYLWRMLQRRVKAGEQLIREQLSFVEARHEELRAVYLEQERTTVELSRKVNQLTTLHGAGLLFSSTMDREALLQNVLETIVHKLHYDRAMIAFYDRDRQVCHDTRILGVSEEIASFVRSLEVPVKDPDSLEGTVLLQGKSFLVGNIRADGPSPSPEPATG